MAFVCKEIDSSNNCLLWIEQVSLVDLLAITASQAWQISFGFALLFIVCAAFNRLSKIGDSNHG